MNKISNVILKFLWTFESHIKITKKVPACQMLVTSYKLSIKTRYSQSTLHKIVHIPWNLWKNVQLFYMCPRFKKGIKNKVVFRDTEWVCMFSTPVELRKQVHISW